MKRLLTALLIALPLLAGAQSLLQEPIARGRVVYDANCASCHGANGMGAAAGVPALANSKVVLYDTARQLRIMLDGTPRGMPAWAGNLTDAQIADAVTYTKNAWANATGVIMMPSTVSASRSRGGGCVDQLFSPLPQPTGANLVHQVVSPAGKAAAWWCLLPVRQGDAAGTGYWRTQVYPVHNDDASKLVLVTAAGRIAIASDPIGQAWSEVNAARVNLVPGSRKAYDYEYLGWLGCEKLRTSPLPDGTSFDPPLPANYCGVPPVPPVIVLPPPGVYIVTATQAFPLKPDGTRSTTPWPTPAIRGEPADGSVQIIQFGARFCKVPRLSSAQTTVVAGCSVKP